ncbi:PAS domain-containing sensor histidine kinase [Aequorivita flava]|uniref:histidine kinase n=1 Tax=Aequorivita flava TaxID=3114371 RepID=A0AB35YSL1_9FLAO
MERAIDKRKDQFYEMLLNAPSAIGMLKGANHVFEIVNPLYLQLTGKSDVIGKSLAEVFPEIKAQGIVSILDKVYQTGSVCTGKEMLIEIDREGNGNFTQFYVDFLFQPYRDVNGDIIGVLFFINDLTEQVISKKEIEKSEKQYRRILETSQEGIWLLDENCKTTFVNKKICEILEYTEAEMLGKTNYDFMVSGEKENALRALKRRKKGIAEQLEYKFVSKSGKQIITKVSANPIFDEKGNFNGSLGMLSDITEKEHLEKLLERSNRLARIGSWEIDVVKGTVFWSDITKEIREVDQDYVPDLSTGIGFFTEGKNQQIIAQRVKECIEFGRPWDEELQFSTFKGNLKWVRTIGEAVITNGKCTKIYGSFQDITERKNALDKIVRSEAKLKIAQTVARVGSWEVELTTNVQYWSEEMYRILGADTSITPSPEAFLKFIHPEDREFVAKSIDQAITQHEGASFNFRFIKPNNEIAYGLSEWRYEYDDEGKPLYISGILRDLTKEKKAEMERLNMISDLHQRNKDLEQFSYIVSHNLRSPVANIIGLTEELKDETHSVEVKKMLREALISDAHRLQNVIADLNSILQTKTENSERKSQVVFSDLTQDIKLSISGLLNEEEVTIVTDFSAIDSFNTIKSYMQSIFYNLISNSIKFRRAGVKPVIEIRSQLTDDKLRLIFKDNGSGINLNKKGHELFKLYKRFHANTEGRGMGLYMVKTQVETLGGKISVASTLNKGTEFTIEFEHLV